MMDGYTCIALALAAFAFGFALGAIMTLPRD